MAGACLENPLCVAKFILGEEGISSTETVPVADNLTGGKLENPLPIQDNKTRLITPDQRGEQGSRHTGNVDGKPGTGGNTTVTPIPVRPSLDDLIYRSNGADNTAIYHKLKEALILQNLKNIATQDPRLAKAIDGGTSNPNFSIGKGTASEAEKLGKIWVGDGARLTSDGTGLVSVDGSRVYRFPKDKPNTPEEFTSSGVQANFEMLKNGQRLSNGHMDIIK